MKKSESQEERKHRAKKYLMSTWLTNPMKPIDQQPGYHMLTTDTAIIAELLDFEMKHSGEAERFRRRMALSKAEKLGCPGNDKIGAYVLELEEKLAEMADKMSMMQYSIDTLQQE